MINQVAEFELTCKRPIGHSIARVDYQFDDEGFHHFRGDGVLDFEYIPLSHLYLKMEDNTYFHFTDSNKFCEYYYTLDTSTANFDSNLLSSEMSNDRRWVDLVGKTITNVTVEWDLLKDITSDQKIPTSYPRYIELTFSNSRRLLITAGEIEKLENDKYRFVIPDESLILCFQRNHMKDILIKISYGRHPLEKRTTKITFERMEFPSTGRIAATEFFYLLVH